MPVGSMRHRCVIQRLPTTEDELGGRPTNNWVPFLTVWGDITEATGKEVMQSLALKALQTTQVRIRYRSGIKPDMRLTYKSGTKVLNIRAVLNEQMENRFLLLICENLSDGGS